MKDLEKNEYRVYEKFTEEGLKNIVRYNEDGEIKEKRFYKITNGFKDFEDFINDLKNKGFIDIEMKIFVKIFKNTIQFFTDETDGDVYEEYSIAPMYEEHTLENIERHLKQTSQLEKDYKLVEI